MTTKFLDNHICTFKFFLSWRFPRTKKNVFGRFSSPPPRPTPLKSANFIFIVVSPSLICDRTRSLGNGVRKNGVRNRRPYQRCGVDTEIPYRLFSLILCSGESVEAEFTRWFWRHRGSRY